MSVKPVPAEGAEEPKKKSKLKLIVIVVLLLVLGGGAAYWFVLRPTPAKAAPKPGTVVKLDPIQVNLTGEHYLRLGLALQLEDGVKEADGSKALDAAIDEFSGRNITELSNPVKRRGLKKELAHRLEKLYPDEVMGVYFTDFVTQ